MHHRQGDTVPHPPTTAVLHLLGSSGFQGSQRNSFLAPLPSWRPLPRESRAHHWARPTVLLGSGVGSGVACLPSPGVQATPGGGTALSCYRHCLPHWAPRMHLGPVLLWTLCPQPPVPGGLLGHPTSPLLPTPGLCSWPLFQTLPALGLINLPVYSFLFITRYRLLGAQVPIDRSGVTGPEMHGFSQAILLPPRPLSTRLTRARPRGWGKL